MEYYGVKYTVNDIPLIIILEGIDSTSTIAPVVWAVGSMNMNDLSICKYVKRSQVVVKNSDAHKIVRIRPCIVVDGKKIVEHNLIILDVLLEEFGLTSDMIMLLKRTITSISENASIKEHNPAVTGDWFPESREWVLLLV